MEGAKLRYCLVSTIDVLSSLLDARPIDCIMIWLIKIPLVILVGAWAIWLYSTPSAEVERTFKRMWAKSRSTAH